MQLSAEMSVLFPSTDSLSLERVMMLSLDSESGEIKEFILNKLIRQKLVSDSIPRLIALRF
jgi:hypothetical protein